MSMWDEMDATEAGSSLEGWKPEAEGDMIVGLVTGIGSGSSDYGDFNVVQVQELDRATDKPTGAEMGIPMFGAVLKNWFERKRSEIVPGATIAVRYDGTVPGKGANPYRAYTCRIKAPPLMAQSLTEPDTTLPF